MKRAALLLLLCAVPASGAVVRGAHPLGRSAAIMAVTRGECGDGVFEAPEACDDGDTDAGDGCSATCTVEAGYACAGSPSVCSDSPEFYAPLASATTDTAGGATATFTRATAATGETWDAGCTAATLATVASGSVRYDSRCAASTLYTGAMFEPAAQNTILQSQTFQTTWLNQNSTETADTTVSPDGTQTADTLTDNAVNTRHEIYQSTAASGAGVTIKFSAYVKQGTADNCGIVSYKNATDYANYRFNFAAGTLNKNTTSITASWTDVRNIGGGWYRIAIAHVADDTTARGRGLNVCHGAPTNCSYVGDGKTCVFWGAQVDEVSTPANIASYIPTTTTAVTRNADALSYAYNGTSSGTLEAKILCPAADLTADGAAVTLSDGTTDNQVSIQVLAAGDAPKVTITAATAAQAAITGTTDVFDGAPHTLRVTYNSSGATLYVDGSSEGTPDSDGVTVPTTNALKVGDATGVVLPGCLVYGIKHYNEVVTP